MLYTHLPNTREKNPEKKVITENVLSLKKLYSIIWIKLFAVDFLCIFLLQVYQIKKTSFLVSLLPAFFFLA